MNQKVKIIAIAKDEAPYLGEWIFHHKYFGFDEIEVLVNRTTDDSARILDDIAKIESSVKWKFIDWVDLVEGNVPRDIQKIAYAQAYSENQHKFSHILFIDIDEFWTPANFNDSIADSITKLADPDGIYFEWLAEDGHEEPFTPLIKKHRYKLHPLGKSLIHTRSNPKKLSIHRHFLPTGSQYVLANGQSFVPSEANSQSLAPSLSSVKEYFIIHRMARSEEEYISLIYRGNPEHIGKFKDNRHGYSNFKSESIELCFDDEAWEKYIAARTSFLSRLSQYHDIETPKQLVMQSYEQSVSQINTALLAGETKLIQTLAGIRKDHGLIKTTSNDYRGRLDLAGKDRIAGWAVDSLGNSCRLTFFINSKKILTLNSDKTRGDLLSKGISTGLGGFDFSISDNRVTTGSTYALIFDDGSILCVGSF